VARNPQHVCILPDNRRVTFRVSLRDGQECYLAFFRGPTGRRLEKTTKEKSQKRAIDAAQQIILQEYQPKAVVKDVPWDDALARLEKAMRGNNNRGSTVDDYLDTLGLLRRFYPDSRGPGDITPQVAKDFKARYQEEPFFRRMAKPLPSQDGAGQRRGRKPKPRPAPVAYQHKARTVDGRLRKFRAIWGKWFIRELEIVSENPWSGVARPKVEKPAPRYVKPEEIKAFFDWLTGRWQGWRLPVLFFTVKSYIGNRIDELASLRSEQLQEGRIVFAAGHTKGRKERKAILPPDLFAELQGIAGPTYVWEGYSTQLIERLRSQGKPTHMVNPAFSPGRLKWWLQDELADYFQANPQVPRFSAHSFRKKAMTEAWRLGIPLEKAAVAFGCNPATMRAHYIALDETATADEVLTAVAQVVEGKSA
jgi:integrase